VSALLLNLDVPDLAAAEAFYRAVFGLRPGRRFGAEAVELLGLAAPLYLLRKAAGSPATPAAGTLRGYDRHWTPLHLDLVVEDLDAACARAQAAGARPEGGVRDERWGRIAAFADPFGHGFCLIQWRGRGYDEIAS
jgi:catechol 2,3-dioxygenase-like lactoylglutathione lyase family enzyme